MGTKKAFLQLAAAVFLLFGPLAARGPEAQTGVSNLNITGKIDTAQHGYIIRGRAPAEVFTILNPEPDILDAFVKSEKTVSIEVRIVSGDNVEIETIDGKKYPQGTQ